MQRLNTSHPCMAMLQYLQHTSRKVDANPQHGGMLWQDQRTMIAQSKSIVK